MKLVHFGLAALVSCALAACGSETTTSTTSSASATTADVAGDHDAAGATDTTGGGAGDGGAGDGGDGGSGDDAAGAESSAGSADSTDGSADSDTSAAADGGEPSAGDDGAGGEAAASGGEAEIQELYESYWTAFIDGDAETACDLVSDGARRQMIKEAQTTSLTKGMRTCEELVTYVSKLMHSLDEDGSQLRNTKLTLSKIRIKGKSATAKDPKGNPVSFTLDGSTWRVVNPGH